MSQSASRSAAAIDGEPTDAELREAWRDRLEQALEEVGGQPRLRAVEDFRPDASEKVDVSDQSVLDLEREIDLIRDDRDVAAAEAIREALQRLDDGTFGLCVDCGAPVASARLMALPYAARCLDCQQRAERQR
jgi:DnaK suppressor protein